MNEIASLEFRMLGDQITGHCHVLAIDGPDVGHGGLDKIEGWTESLLLIPAEVNVKEFLQNFG